MKRWLAILTVLGAGLAGCGKSAPDSQVSSQVEARDVAVSVASNDTKMLAAMEQARATISTFVTALQAPKPGQTDFLIKLPFTDGETIEHMWVNELTYDGTHFHGELCNNPERLTTVKIGAKVTVAPAKISDWMYVENGKLVGGTTTRVLRDSLTPAERAEFDKDLTFKIN